MGICVTAIAASLSSAVAFANAEGAEQEQTTPVLTMQEGASIRYMDPVGIRFVTDVTTKKYNEIINVCKYLLSLGITEDGTKKGIKGRIEKAISKFNEEFNTNYDYQSKNNLIINLDNGEIME